MELTWAFGVVALGWLVITVAITDDAARRGNSWLWGLATLVFGVFAALLYLLYRNDERVPMYRCRECKSIFYRPVGIDRHERNTGHDVEQVTGE
ncbi:hypothetical protein Hbl1158_14155 [Halobaculum sp. CBA1158]|uniref:hypothetical protein n=1 Tax=Halobaculum sp. CBA1158 TaxID=2904243 RepID=UPI001F2BB15D|nr:hypothetical protein [Halobaculum sp. CBA1158]UIO99652.1 hypothetical protein Hbl1158_14155 [Halobaculum sp. CBA1158]